MACYMAYENTKERNKMVKHLNQFANDRARLEHGLRVTLGSLGVGDAQVNKIIKDVRLADFESLNKTMRIK